MEPINRSGPPPVDLTAEPEKVDPAELRRRIDAGEWVVDLRERTAFAAGHLAGSMGFELSRNFVTYLGWLYPDGDTALTLIGESPEQVADARRELVRIGIDSIAGAAVGDIDDLAVDQAPRSYPVRDFAALAGALAAGPVNVVDARRDDERAQGGVAGSLHAPQHQLRDRARRSRPARCGCTADRDTGRRLPRRCSTDRTAASSSSTTPTTQHGNSGRRTRADRTPEYRTCVGNIAGNVAEMAEHREADDRRHQALRHQPEHRIASTKMPIREIHQHGLRPTRQEFWAMLCVYQAVRDVITHACFTRSHRNRAETALII